MDVSATGVLPDCAAPLLDKDGQAFQGPKCPFMD